MGETTESQEQAIPLAVVTGASRGIGRAVALALARAGFRVAGLARNTAELREAMRGCEVLTPDSRGFTCDVADTRCLLEVCGRIEAELGVPDVIINNAGVVLRGRVDEFVLEHLDQQLATNLRAPFVVTRAFLPAMKRRGSGRVLNVGSISGTLGTAGAAGYCATKWGIIGFTKSLAEELADSGLMTAVVLPGSVDTEMLEGSGFSPHMTADDVARTLLYLATEAPLAHNGASVEMFGV